MDQRETDSRGEVRKAFCSQITVSIATSKPSRSADVEADRTKGSARPERGSPRLRQAKFGVALLSASRNRPLWSEYAVNRTGQIVILNGPPRTGKSSIASAIQGRFDGVWMNLGVDAFKAMRPDRYQPGIGLRPGGERPDLERLVELVFRAMYESIAAHSRLGVNVVVDANHHDWYSSPRGILPRCARLLDGLPVLFIGVRCPLEVVIQRRRATWGAGQPR